MHRQLGLCTCENRYPSAICLQEFTLTNAYTHAGHGAQSEDEFITAAALSCRCSCFLEGPIMQTVNCFSALGESFVLIVFTVLPIKQESMKTN